MRMTYKGAVAGISLIVAGLLGATAHAADKIAFIAANMANESQAFSSKQFQKFGKDYGFEVVVLDAKGDTQTESQLVTNSIAQKFKAIFLNPNDINAIVPSVMKAKQAGVVVGMFSSDLAPANQKFRDFFVGVNDTMAGEAAGDAFLKKFPNGATIVEVGGQAGHDAQIKRHDGFNKKIKGSKIEVIDYKTPQQWSTAEAMAIMEDLVVKHGKKIQGVFCHWDNGVTGVAQALKAANMLDGTFIVGVDGNRAGYVQVQGGEQSVSIAQDFTVMAKKDLELARAVLDKKKVEPVNFVPLTVVDKALIASGGFDSPEW